MEEDLCDKNLVYIGGMGRKLTKPRPEQGARLVELRKAASLSQTDLAELIGESQQTIANWEQSDKPPRSSVLPKMAGVLGVSIETILGNGKPARRRAGPVGKMQRVFDEVSNLPRRQQEQVVQFVSTLLEQYKREARKSART